MCGIIGVFGQGSSGKVDSALPLLSARGRDGSGKLDVDGGTLGHTLHAVVSNVKQPIKRDGVLTANCEIYNWKELGEADNDADMLLQILDEGRDLELLDGVYAFGHVKDGILTVARDIIGVKPVWYSHSDGFAFCSEKKVLEALGYGTIFELNPRRYIRYHIKENRLELIDREYFTTKPLLTTTDKLKELIVSAVKKRIPNQKAGVLFSGGVDSTLIALLLKQLGVDCVCYTTAVDLPGMKESQDMLAAREAAEKHGFELRELILSQKEIEDALPRVVKLIEDSNVVKVGVALTLDAACKAAAEDGCKVVFSGLGSEEIFAGYQRHRESSNLNDECLSGLRKIYERDTYRDDVISMSHSVELRLPFLDKELTKYALRIPPELKIKDGVEKFILRQTALEIGLDESIAMRKKKAAQYGSNVHKAIEKLSKTHGHSRLSEYLITFYPSRQIRLVSLMSSGKDSHYALYTMVKQNYNVKCLLSIQSKNPDSYMFHTPNIELAKLQADSIGIPLIIQETKGEKEIELKDLEEGLKKAIEQYQVEGVVTGALYSTYQRNRIEKICEKLGLKVFSPLWHIDQETEVRQLIAEGFEVMLSSIACDGLDKSWLGRPLSGTDVDKLVELNRKIRINIAGEGGEYESLVTNGPLFSKPIRIEESEIISESEHVARFIVKKAVIYSNSSWQS